MTYHYVDGSFVTEEEAKINIFDLGLLRGYGVFDYVQLYGGKPFHLFDHLKRLKWSAEQIGLELPMGLNEIEEMTLQLIAKNPPNDAGIRFMITGGAGAKDFLLPTARTTLLMLYHPYDPHPTRFYTQGMRVITTHLQRLDPCVKATNYMPAVLAMKAANEVSADDAIYLNPSNELLEATTSNLFFFKKGKWITARDDQVVNGVTRSLFLKFAQEQQYQLEFRALSVDEIESCEEAFLCSSVKDAVPLVRIDDKMVGKGVPGPHTAKMRTHFHVYLENYFKESICQPLQTSI